MTYKREETEGAETREIWENRGLIVPVIENVRCLLSANSKEISENPIFQVQSSTKIQPEFTESGSIKSESIDLINSIKSEKYNSVLKTVESAGFSCLVCGKCCERNEADNSVFILPAEIEKIETKILFDRKEFVIPLFPDFYSVHENTGFIDLNKIRETVVSLKDQTDDFGRIHTFGWMLRRKENGECIFLENETKKCKIYDCRPELCQTYPFYFSDLNDDDVEECECCGIGTAAKTELENAAELTDSLFSRLFEEQKDFEKTKFFLEKNQARSKLNSEIGAQKSIENLKSGLVKFVVYDGTGIFEADVKYF